ncbi:MAG: hypothetical protein ABIY56_05170 [Dokdonella sp.]
MAVVNTKGTAVNGADSAPPSPDQNVSLKLHAGRVKESIGVVAAVSGDSIGSTYRLARVKTSIRISQLLLSCSAITGGAADVGVYDVAANGGAAISQALFASAQSLATALTNSDITHESGTFPITAIEQPLWQALGLATDPGKLVDIVATLSAAAGAAGSVGLKVKFVDGN